MSRFTSLFSRRRARQSEAESATKEVLTIKESIQIDRNPPRLELDIPGIEPSQPPDRDDEHSLTTAGRKISSSPQDGAATPAGIQELCKKRSMVSMKSAQTNGSRTKDTKRQHRRRSLFPFITSRPSTARSNTTDSICAMPKSPPPYSPRAEPPTSPLPEKYQLQLNLQAESFGVPFDGPSVTAAGTTSITSTAGSTMPANNVPQRTRPFNPSNGWAPEFKPIIDEDTPSPDQESTVTGTHDQSNDVNSITSTSNHTRRNSSKDGQQETSCSPVPTTPTSQPQRPSSSTSNGRKSIRRLLSKRHPNQVKEEAQTGDSNDDPTSDEPATK